VFTDEEINDGKGSIHGHDAGRVSEFAAAENNRYRRELRKQRNPAIQRVNRAAGTASLQDVANLGFRKDGPPREVRYGRQRNGCHRRCRDGNNSTAVFAEREHAIISKSQQPEGMDVPMQTLNGAPGVSSSINTNQLGTTA
jgi:hypothetical protein